MTTKNRVKYTIQGLDYTAAEVKNKLKEILNKTPVNPEVEGADLKFVLEAFKTARYYDEKAKGMSIVKVVRKKAENVSKNDETLSEPPCNYLEISGSSFKNKKKNKKKSKKKSKKEEITTSSSKEDIADEPWKSCILSFSEAQKHFCFYHTPGSTPYQKLMPPSSRRNQRRLPFRAVQPRYG